MKETTTFVSGAMNPGSTGCQPVVRGSLPRTGFATPGVFVAAHSASGRMLQASGLCSPDLNVRALRVSALYRL
jgi:hypothetical protein